MVKHISSTFTITIKKKDESYTIEAHSQKGIRVKPKPAPQLKTLLFDEQIKTTLKDLANDRGTATTHAIQKLGKALYDALFIQPVLLAFGKAQGHVKNGDGVRLRLRIEPPELAILPWETLYDGQEDWLSTKSTTPLVRQLILEDGSKILQKPKVRRELKILFVAASPRDLDNLDIEKTKTELEELLKESIKKRKIVFNVLLNTTLAALQKELQEDYHILYFTGHGSPKGIFLDDGGGKSLKEEDKVVGREKGSKYLVSAKTLAQDLEGKQTRLVFLAACNTNTAPDESSLLAGFAQELAQQAKLPAIVAMQYFISNRQANSLTTQFFAALAAGRPVDVALAEARKPLIKKEKAWRDVFSPVLYLQAEDGTLFQKPKPWRLISMSVALLGVTTVAMFTYWQVRMGEILTLSQSTQQLVRSEGYLIDSMLEGLKARRLFQQTPFPSEKIQNALKHALNEAVLVQNFFKEKNRLLGHSDEIRSLAWSSDGDILASGSKDGKIKLWNEKGQELITLRAPSEVFSVAWSPDGNLLATGGVDGTVKLWNREGKKLAIFSSSLSNPRSLPSDSTDSGVVEIFRSSHSGFVESLAWSADGEILASASSDGTVKLWNREGKELAILWGHSVQSSSSKRFSVRFKSVAWSQDGKILATGSEDGTVKLWNREGKELATLSGHFGLITSVAWSKDGILASSSEDGTVRLWNREGKELATLFEHLQTINSVAWSEDGILASGSDDGTVKLWDREGKELVTLQGVFGEVDRIFSGVKSVAWHGNGQTLASGNHDGTMRLWNREKKELVTLSGHFRGVSTLDWSPDGEILASGAGDRTVKLWNREGKELLTLLAHSERVSTLDWSPDGEILASSSLDKRINLWDWKKEELMTTVFHADVSFSSYMGVESLSWDPDGEILASGSSDGTVKLWNREGKELSTLSARSRNVDTVDWSSDGDILATGGSDFLGGFDIKLWNREGKELARFNNICISSYSLAWIPNEKILANSCFDGTIKLFNVEGKILATLSGHSEKVNSLAWSPNGEILASGSQDGTVKLWNREGKDLLTFSKHFGTVNSVAWNNDGTILTIGDNKNIILRKNFDYREPVVQACDYLKDYLTYSKLATLEQKTFCDNIDDTD